MTKAPPRPRRVRTRAEPYMWLHALDPLEPGNAANVRTAWSQKESDATVFPSKAYADQVAVRNPGDWHYVFIDAELTA